MAARWVVRTDRGDAVTCTPFADVAGVDHTPLDALWAGCRREPFAYHLWQYAHAVV